MLRRLTWSDRLDKQILKPRQEGKRCYLSFDDTREKTKQEEKVMEFTGDFLTERLFFFSFFLAFILVQVCKPSLSGRTRVHAVKICVERNFRTKQELSLPSFGTKVTLLQILERKKNKRTKNRRIMCHRNLPHFCSKNS